MGRACLLVLAISSLCFLLKAVTGMPVESGIPVLENFDVTPFLGKWNSIALATDYPRIQQIRAELKMTTYSLEESDQPGKIHASHLFYVGDRRTNMSVMCDKLQPPGRFALSRSRSSEEFRVIRGKHHEYAVVVFYSHGANKTVTTLRLFGRAQELRPALLEDFRQISLDQGIPEECIFLLPKADECVSDKTLPESQNQQRVRRMAVVEPEEGSGLLPSNVPFFSRTDVEAACQLPAEPGICFGHHERFHYNQSTMTCAKFVYGGCSGNGNNFLTEQICLQRCRTVAACRLPIEIGPCKIAVDLWAFDSVLGKCKPFIYGGCQGNGNKFYSLKECEEYCDAVPAEEADLLPV
uniref:Protein AMBP n=1 Tax=Callorhinchus milii TaxID=7868 RepID=K4GHC2_CALMI|nr:alpha-1-microglobulin [Callorhinchus milii]